MKKFAIIGLGYIAPRHLEAIKSVGGTVVAACDVHDCGGILDSYNLHCLFFRSEIDFFNHISPENTDYLVVCTPNRLHFAHTYAAVAKGISVICEKPLFTLRHQADLLQPYAHKIFCILQLRLHPMMDQVRAALANQQTPKIELYYHTPRGQWYEKSWKSDPQNGGVLMNIGIHLFDLLIFLLGEPLSTTISRYDTKTAHGVSVFPTAEVHWELSTDPYLEPTRSIVIDDSVFFFTQGFTGLHAQSYYQILIGNGFTLHDALPALDMVMGMR